MCVCACACVCVCVCAYVCVCERERERVGERRGGREKCAKITRERQISLCEHVDNRERRERDFTLARCLLR